MGVLEQCSRPLLRPKEVKNYVEIIFPYSRSTIKAQLRSLTEAELQEVIASGCSTYVEVIQQIISLKRKRLKRT